MPSSYFSQRNYWENISQVKFNLEISNMEQEIRRNDNLDIETKEAYYPILKEIQAVGESVFSGKSTLKLRKFLSCFGSLKDEFSSYGNSKPEDLKEYLIKIKKILDIYDA